MTACCDNAELVFHAAGARVWLCDLDAAECARFDDASVLSAEERARVARLKLPLAQRRFVRSHVIARHLLAFLLKREPGGIVLGTAERGKPFVSGCEALDFNFSHSENAFLFGACFGGEIGVDVEMMRDDFDVVAVAETVLPPVATGRLEMLRPAERGVAFFQAWALNEAQAKATGRRLAGDANVDVGDVWRQHQAIVQVGGVAAAAAVVFRR
ncbi:MAG: hypothetical protein HZA91_17405 [Verrucomicrobia bacterium]|nr:hypothetical protein [Verrucomicrobiota bacterium]